MASKYAFSRERMKDFYEHPEKYYVKPFRIFANLYFVGNKDVGSYLLDTEEGLILIDTTYPTSQAQMIEAIWEAGFSPENIQYIVHTHGHFDHIGTTAFLKSLSGAKTSLGEGDAKMFAERPELMLAEDAGPAHVEVFSPDVILQDGDEIRLGSTTIQVIATPGHTMGVLTFLIQLEENGEKHLAGLCGGIGINTLCRDFQERYQVPEYRKYFVSSMQKIKNLPVDLVLGNHTGQNHTMEKRAAMGQNPDGTNPFVVPGEWKQMIEGAIEQYETMLREETDGTDQEQTEL